MKQNELSLTYVNPNHCRIGSKAYAQLNAHIVHNAINTLEREGEIVLKPYELSLSRRNTTSKTYTIPNEFMISYPAYLNNGSPKDSDKRKNHKYVSPKYHSDIQKKYYSDLVDETKRKEMKTVPGRIKHGKVNRAKNKVARKQRRCNKRK